MLLSRFFSLRVVIAIIATIILANAAYAFAAANTVAESGAGEGSAVISGYNITAIKYTLSTTNPSSITAVQFNVAPIAGAAAPTNVMASLLATDTYHTCTSGTAGTTWTCTISPGVSVTSAVTLSVVASQ